jgi:hypothetical protein
VKKKLNRILTYSLFVVGLAAAAIFATFRESVPSKAPITTTAYSTAPVEEPTTEMPYPYPAPAYIS